MHNVTLAIQLRNGQHSEGGKGELSGWGELEENKVQFLLFADDLVLVAENEEDIKKNAEVLNEVMKK